MKIVQRIKDTSASGQVDSRRNEYLLPAMPTDSIFVGEMQSKILIPQKLQHARLQQTQPQQCTIIQG